MNTEKAIEVLVRIAQFLLSLSDEIPYTETVEYREHRREIDRVINLLQEGEGHRKALEQVKRVIKEAEDEET